jgi:hypothetical protein
VLFIRSLIVVEPAAERRGAASSTLSAASSINEVERPTTPMTPMASPATLRDTTAATP